MSRIRNENYEEKYYSGVYKYLFNKKIYWARSIVAHNSYFKSLPSDLSVFEFGCGLGKNIYHLTKSRNGTGGRVVGYDISKFALDFCRKKELTVTDNLDKLGKFDVVFSSHVLEHVPNPLETLKLLRSKIKDNGRLILVLPYEKHGKSSLTPDINRHLYAWNFRTINNLLDEAGYKVVSNSISRYGAGYSRLLFLKSISLGLYLAVTNFLGRLTGCKELKILAVKK